MANVPRKLGDFSLVLKETERKNTDGPLRLKAWYACATNRLVYFNIPKSACTTIRSVMYYLDYGEYPKDELDIHRKRRALISGAREPDRLLRKLIRKHYAFTFIRSPEQRVYSCYTDKIHSSRQDAFVDIRKYLTAHHGLKLNDDVGTDVGIIRENFLKFLIFVSENLSRKNDIRRNDHWQPQAKILRRSAKDVPLHFIGLVEKLPCHLPFVLQRGGVEMAPTDIPKLHRSSSVDVRLEAIMTPEITSLIHGIYSADFELYHRVQNETARLEQL